MQVLPLVYSPSRSPLVTSCSSFYRCPVPRYGIYGGTFFFSGLQPITLEQASMAIEGHLATSHMEVSLVGDFDTEEVGGWVVS